MKLHKSLLMACFVLVTGIAISIASAQEEELLEESELVLQMHANLDWIGEVKAAIIAGDLEAARESAAGLAEHHSFENLPREWESHVERMRSSAAAVAKSTSIATAAAQLGGMAQSCGDCHAANKSVVIFGFDQKPRGDVGGPRTHMHRDLWGVDRMWDGLIGPSDIAWDRGCGALADSPLAAEEMQSDSNGMEGLRELASQIHILGEKGAQLETAANRSRIFGELLGSCGTCHSQLKVGTAH